MIKPGSSWDDILYSKVLWSRPGIPLKDNDGEILRTFSLSVLRLSQRCYEEHGLLARGCNVRTKPYVSETIFLPFLGLKSKLKNKPA